jgi:hypothetical protein
MKTMQQFRAVRRLTGVVSRYKLVVVDGKGVPHQLRDSTVL